MVSSRVRPALVFARDRAIEEEDERYNPIRPSNGNTIVGGSNGATSRSTRHSMADKRAMEIQMRNQTPGTGATPVMGVSQYRGGSGATPSMGLSEFRGGSYDRCVGGSYDRCVGGNIERSNVSQSGAYQGQGRRRNSSASNIMSSAHLTARELSDHIAKQHGKKYHREFMEGMMMHGKGLHGGGWWGDMWNKIKNEVVNKESRLRKDIIPKAAEYTAKAAPVLDAAGAFVGVPGAGTALASGAQGLHRFNEGAKSVGLGRGGRRKRAPASAGDGRRKRADIVRKVMAERGVKMIEASKIVKAEGLY
jgi:hypothetical protein